jgi:hypothetical protein
MNFCSMMRWRSYVGMLVLTYDASAICQDPNLFLPEADSKDLVVPVCHHYTPAIAIQQIAPLSNTKQ